MVKLTQTGLSISLLFMMGAAHATVTCPGGFSMQDGKCMATLPTQSPAEFMMDTTGNPVCGPERLPVRVQNGQFQSLNVASSTVPRSAISATYQGLVFPFSIQTTSTNPPQYVYQGYTHCLCVGATIPSLPQVTTAPSPTSLYLETGNGVQVVRFPRDDMTYISGVHSLTDLVPYSPVPISKRPAAGGSPVDGRVGADFTLTPQMSACGCPNFNEDMARLAPDSVEPSGAKCVPSVHSSDPNYPITLSTFSASADDAPNATKIRYRDRELDSEGHLITKIIVPYSQGSSAGGVYTRRIWKCSGPLQLNTSTGNCEATNSYHAAGPGNGSTIPVSEVSPRAKGMTDSDKWNNTVNKKFAACLNGFGTTTNINGTSGVKFDCVDNNIIHYVDFNDLWSSTDKPDDGGLPNALTLANAQGNVISGFYTLDGKHCDQFSEFAGELKPAIVNPKMQSTTDNDSSEITYVGDPLKLPGTGNGGATAEYNAMKDKFQNLNKTVPRSANDMRTCPLLVRAAAVYSCPENRPGDPNNATYQEPPNGPEYFRRQCTAVKDVKIHLRVEQLYEIRGQSKMTTLDTVANAGTGASVSIQRIIAEKYGKECPPGMKRDDSSGACGWY